MFDKFNKWYDSNKNTILKVLDWFIIGVGIVAVWLGEYAMAASQFSFVAAMNVAFKREP